MWHLSKGTFYWPCETSSRNDLSAFVYSNGDVCLSVYLLSLVRRHRSHLKGSGSEAAVPGVPQHSQVSSLNGENGLYMTCYNFVTVVMEAVG